MSMFYAMKTVDGVSVRIGRMTQIADKAVRVASRHTGGYVEEYGYGVVWTPKASMLGMTPGTNPGGDAAA